jgi:Ca-activated chloride channel family protein
MVLIFRHAISFSAFLRIPDFLKCIFFYFPSAPSASLRSIGLCFLMLVGFWTIPSEAQSARGLVKEGNRAYAKGEYAKALERYGKASVDAPESAVVALNRGDALFKQGDFAKAKEAFEKAAIKAGSVPFEAKCRYNIGNVELRLAQRQRDADPRKAIAGYEQAIRIYQDALRLDPKLQDAAHNLEVARVLMKSLLDELQKNPQGVDQRQKQNQEMRKELEKLIQEQEQQAGACQALDQKQKKGQQDDLSKEMQQAVQEQQGTKEKTGDLSKKMEEAQKQQPQQPQQGQSPMEKSREELDKAQKEQGSAAQDLQKKQPGEAKPKQDKATGHLKKALEELGGNPDQGAGQQGEEKDQKDKKDGKEKEKQQGPGQPPPDPKKENKAQRGKQAGKEGEPKPRDEKAQDILREEQQNRDKQMRAVQGGYSPVDKDW